jgi:hypothetical protein
MTVSKSLLRPATIPRRAASLMGRLGYAARGAIYLMVGVSAGMETIWPEHRPGGWSKVLGPLAQHWTGGLILLVLASGMACFAGWLAISALLRHDHTGPAHFVLLAGTLGDAAIYVGFAVGILGSVTGAVHGGGDREMQAWIAPLLGDWAGRVLVGVVGTIVAACGIGLVAWAAIGDIEGPLELPRTERKLLQPVGRYGTGGRGAAIALVGCGLFAAMIHGDPREARELGGMLAAVRSYPYGAVATGLLALAFIGSSLLDFAIAAFRRFDPGRT